MKVNEAMAVYEDYMKARDGEIENDKPKVDGEDK